MTATIVLREMIKIFPTQKFDSLSDSEFSEFSSIIDMLCDIYSMGINEIINCYKTFVRDTLEESKFFFEHERYRYASFKEVNEYMYSKDEHYMRKYQVGLLISLFLWPTHSEMRRHFIDVFNKKEGEGYLEVGVGHGYYFSLAMQNSNFSLYMGVDINKESLHIANRVVENRLSTLTNKNYKLELIDFFNINKKFDAIVSGEVLEHVENPLMFLQKIESLSHSNTFIYVTTVINAPEIDHIYLFSNPDEIRELFRASGLKIIDERFFLYRNKPLDVCIRKKWPVIVAIQARKA